MPWLPLGPGGGGATGPLVRIGQTVVGVGGAASVSFSAIPGTYESLYLIFSARSEIAGNVVELSFRFNGDTGANYWWNTLYLVNSAGGDSQSTGLTAGRAGVIPRASAPANEFGPGWALIPGYSRTDRNKQLLGMAGYRYGTGATNQGLDFVNSGWLSTAAVTQVTLLDTGGDLLQGSVFTLYGIEGT